MSHFLQVFEQDYDTLIRSFESISAIKDDLRRQYVLSRAASWHGLTRSEMHRFFKAWLLQRISGGES